LDRVLRISERHLKYLGGILVDSTEQEDVLKVITTGPINDLRPFWWEMGSSFDLKAGGELQKIPFA